MRYRHLRRTVIAVLAAIAFLLVFGLAVRAVLETGAARRTAIRWLEQTAAGFGVELAIGDLHWGLLPPALHLSQVRFDGAGIAAEAESLRVEFGSVRLTQRTIELSRVAAHGVRLTLSGLPKKTGAGRARFKVRVRQLSLDDVSFEGTELPGKITLDLDGIRSGWSTEGSESRGFAEVSKVRLSIGRMTPVDCSLATRYVLDDNGFEFANYRVEGVGFTLEGHGRVGRDGARFEARGPLDVGWLDDFIRTHGLLDGRAEIAAVVDTRAPALVKAEVNAPFLEAAGFRLDEVAGHLELVDRSLRGTLDGARFHGGTLRGRYELAEFAPRFPHHVHLEGEGISLQGFLDDLRVESAGLAANMGFTADGQWNGSSFPAGHGEARLLLKGSTRGVPVSGAINVDLTGEGFLLFDADRLAIGSSSARWQGALTLGTWRPSWSITAEPAIFSEIGPMVNAWVGSTVLPEGLAGTGQLQVDLSGSFQDLTVSARVDAEPLILSPVEFDRLVSEVTISGSTLRLGTTRFQVGNGFGEVEGGINWGVEVGDDQLDLEMRGRLIPLEVAASWVDLDKWVDSGTISFTGGLAGPLSLPVGAWQVSLDDPMLGGIALGRTLTTVELANGRFRTSNLRCDQGLEGELYWDVGAAEVGGELSWPQMPLDPLGVEVQQLAGKAADVNLDFRLPFNQRPTATLRAVSTGARLDIRGTPETVEVDATIQDALSVHCTLDRDDAGDLSGRGTAMVRSAAGLLDHLAPDSGVPLTGTAEAAFTVSWGDEPLPSLQGQLENLDLDLAKQPIQLIEPATFSLSSEGFDVPGLRLRARDDELFVRWTIDSQRHLRGNVSGTMDALLLRFLMPDWEPAGRASGVVELLGSIDEPEFEGIAEVSGASFRLPETRTILSQVSGTVFLSSGDVQLEGMDFRLMGGRARASGRIQERDDTIVLALDGSADGIRFEVLPKLEARVSGNWRLNGPVDDLLLSGDITVDRTTLNTKEDVAAILLSWLEKSGVSTGEGGLNLALRVDSEETIELRNPFLRLTGSAALEVTGTSNHPGLVGQVEFLEGGEATVLGNRFEIERGSVSFSNPDSVEPFFDVQASTWVQEYQITVQLSGTTDRFVSTAVSTPPLSTPDIYSLLGVGSTGGGYGSGAVGLGLASSILSSELASVLSRRAQLALPVDQVRVDPFAADSTGNPTARLSVIKQLTPSWTVILQSTLSGEREQVVVSRWYLAPGFFIEAGQHEDRSLSLDLKMRRPY